MDFYVAPTGCVNASICDFPSFVSYILGYINLGIELLAAIAVVYFMIGLIRYIRESGDSEGQRIGRQMMTWGLISLVVIFCIGGILLLLKKSFVG